MYALALCQLMVVVDGTVVNLALPVIASEFGVGIAQAGWISTSYLLAVAGFLLLFGRISDVVGHKRILLAGITTFTVASALCAGAHSFQQLVLFRVAQGIGSAMIGPAVLSLMTINFAGTAERVRALTTYNIVSSVGAAVGLIVGGLLTQSASWRMVFAINLPLGVLLLTATWRWLTNVRSETARFNVIGSLLSISGVTLAVYSLIEVGRAGLTNTTIATALLGATCLFALVVVEAGSSHPMVPITAFRDRSIIGGLLVRLFISGSVFGCLYFISFLLREGLKFSPAQCAFALLPIPVVSTICSRTSRRLLDSVSAPTVVVLGLALVAVGALWLAGVTHFDRQAPGYPGLFPGLCLLAAGVGLTFPAIGLMVLREGDRHAGIRSAVFNLAQQVGNPLGLAVMIGLSGALTRSAASLQHEASGLSMKHFEIAFLWAFSSSALAAIWSYWFLVRKMRGK